MANVDRPNGFRPVKSLTGHPVNMMIRRYEAADRTADTTANHGDIYIGDPVELVAGKVAPADSGNTILGVVVGVGTDASNFGEAGPFDPRSLEKRYLAFDEVGYVWVVPAEDMLFDVQTSIDLDLVVGAQADITNTAGTAHGSRVTSQSTCELTTAANNDVEVVEDSTAPDNDTTLANARHFVQFVTTQHAQ